MKTLRQSAGSQRFINEIQLARVRLARAESKWELADEQAREARRRRKEAKQAARQAKKLARQAKKEFAAAKEALIVMEEKFAAAVERAARHRKLARARLAQKAAAARTAAKAALTPGMARPAAPTRPKVRRQAAPSPVLLRLPKFPRLEMAAPKTIKKKKPAARSPWSARVKSATATAVPVVSEKTPIVVPRDFELSQPGAAEILSPRPAAAQLPVPSIPPIVNCP